MGECICSSCRNLKGVIGTEGDVEEYNCEFGFPSENCAECDGTGCNETCSHYVEDSGEIQEETVHCKACGKELKKLSGEDSDGEVYCIDCYLKNFNG